MARVRLIHPEEAEGEAARFLQGSIQLRGRATNAARALANIPHVAKYYLPFGATLQREGLGGVLSSRIKEMVIIKTSQVNGCDYWLTHNTSLGQAAGITDDQVEAICSDDYMTSSCLTPRDRAAVLWAEHVTLNTAKHRDDVFEEVRKHYTDPEIVELTAICGLFNMANRVHDSLRLPIEDRTEVDKIKTSVRPDPQRLKTYLENMVGAWTDDLPDPEESERG